MRLFREITSIQYYEDNGSTLSSLVIADLGVAKVRAIPINHGRVEVGRPRVLPNGVITDLLQTYPAPLTPPEFAISFVLGGTPDIADIDFAAITAVSGRRCVIHAVSGGGFVASVPARNIDPPEGIVAAPMHPRVGSKGVWEIRLTFQLLDEWELSSAEP